MNEGRGKMTYEEAKNLIDDITWKYNGNSITNEMICKCRDKCREALEKQIPKKPIIDEEKFAICPSCKADVTDIYCGVCGQALDWSDEI